MASSKSDQKTADESNVVYFNPEVGVVEAPSIPDAVNQVKSIKEKDEQVGDGK